MGQDFADELCCLVGLRAVKKTIRLSGFNNLAFVREYDSMGHLTGEANLVSDHAHGHSLAGQLDHDVKHLADHLRIQGKLRPGEYLRPCPAFLAAGRTALPEAFGQHQNTISKN